MARKKEYNRTSSDSIKTTVGSNTKGIPRGSNSRSTQDLRRLNIAQRKESAYPGTSTRNVYDVADLRAQLGSFGLTVRDIPGDGNCLFRALGDQLDGHIGNHLKHRLDTVRYMVNHRDHFEPFIDVPFDRYMNDLSRPGTYAGQDALVAFARLHEVNIIIHQLNRPLWKIEGTENINAPELHLSYHNGEHYSSVRRFGDIANTPARIRIMAPAAVSCCASCNVHTSTEPCTSNADCVNLQYSASHKHKHDKNVSNAKADGTCLREKHEFTNLVHQVMKRTGCRDASLATEALIENSKDLDQTVDYLLSVALFVSPENENYSKTFNKNVEVTGKAYITDSLNSSSLRRHQQESFFYTFKSLFHGLDMRYKDKDDSNHRTLANRLPQTCVEIITFEQQEKRNLLQSDGEDQKNNKKQGDLRFLTL